MDEPGGLARPEDDEDEQPDPCALVARALRELSDPPTVPEDVEQEPDRLTDLLLDHGNRFDGMRLLYYLTALQVARFDDRVREHCSQEFLFLDPRAVAEEAVVKTYVSWLEGTRRKPFEMWAWKIVRGSARLAVADPDLAELRLPGASHPELLIASELGRVTNELPFEARRILWLAWIEGMALPAVSHATGVPLERVEWMLTEVVQRAQRAVRRTTGHSTDDVERDGEEREERSGGFHE